MDIIGEILKRKYEKEFDDICDELGIELKLSSGKTATIDTLCSIAEYLMAFSELYGIVPIRTAAELINGYENEAFTEQDIAQFESFYKHIDSDFSLADNYVAYNAVLDIGYFEELKRAQTGKPYAVLPKDVILSYAEEGYFEVPPQYGELYGFLVDEVKIDVMVADEITDEIYFTYRANENGNEISETLKEHNVSFEDEAQHQKFLSITEELKNNTRTCENCGNTPNELKEISANETRPEREKSMAERLIMNNMNVPDGILHDQALSNVSLENNVLTLSFDIHFFSEDIGTQSEKYKAFTKCHIKCKLDEDDMKYGFDEACLESSPDKENRYKGCILSISEFVDIANEDIRMRKEKEWHSWDYLHTFISPNTRQAKIELCICDLKYKGKIYTKCNLELSTEEIEFIWE